MLGLGLFLYMPLRTYWAGAVAREWSCGDRGKTSPFSHGVKRGDRIAYELSGYYFSNHGAQGISDRSRHKFGSGAGKRLRRQHRIFGGSFHRERRSAAASAVHMPVSGNFAVPENHWFIWPNIAISGNWNPGDANISSAMLQLADVPEKQFVGKPFKRWFWRKQILP